MMSTPLQNLPIQQKVWRFLGFSSSLVGLLCFALSSSFKDLFGDWNLLKICVYAAVSFIICSMMLFAKKLQLSRSLLIKAHVGFLVFMLSSLYSFFSDNGQSDMLSLISSGAFALMSFSLSRQINLGFEVELFNFFLGYLVVQLMAIHFVLAFVGGVLCYWLMFLRSQSDSQAPAGTVSVADHVAVEIDDANRVQVGVDHSDRNKELYTILGIEEKREERVVFPTDMEAKLREAMAAGFVEECSHFYFTWRKQILDEKLLRVSLHKLDIKEMDKVPLNFLENKIQRWIMASGYVLRVLLPDERNLCNRVFSGFSPYADICFMEVCWESMTQLLNFAEAVATGIGSPERLFRILKVFEALRELLPDMESLFSDEYSVALRDEAITIWERLREAIKGVFVDLENLIRQDPAKVAVPGGGLHPITHYAMNYLRAAYQSRRTLEQVFEGHEMPSSSFPLSFQVARIIELLERNLEASSRVYKDPALRFVFMMNNKRYIVHSARHSELGKLLGDNWIQKHITEVPKCLRNYERSSWDQVHGILCEDNESLSPDVAVESFKQKLSMFILEFGGLCKVQSTWVIFDERLREKIRSSLKKILLLAYENFIARFSHVMDTEEDTIMYCNFGIQDIVAGIDKLFQGRDELKRHRYMQPTWTVVLPTTKDSHEWRKRGQETFLNSSSYPRDSYWCIHNFDRGCQATKQVQQIQENPPMYETRYKGFHTCRMRTKAPQMLTEATAQEPFSC